MKRGTVSNEAMFFLLFGVLLWMFASTAVAAIVLSIPNAVYAFVAFGALGSLFMTAGIWIARHDLRGPK